MAKAKKNRRSKEAPLPKDYECREPPCIHVVVDERRKIFKIFVEDYDIIIPVPFEKAVEACRKIRIVEELASQGYKEAYGDETDYLARRYLKAEPSEEEYSE